MSPQSLQSNGARTGVAAQAEEEAERQAVAEWSWAEALDRVAGDPSLILPHFQPIVDLGTGRVVGYELLTRFRELSGESPAEWFAAAHRLGRAASLDASILRIATAHLTSLPADLFLSVNLTAAGVVSDEVEAVLSNAFVKGLVVELTDQTEIHDPAALRDRVRQLRDQGARFAIDDAGSGYPTLQRVMMVRPEMIKLDRAFVSNIDVDEAKTALVQMMGTLAQRIGASLLAEGVERVPELERLRELGVPLAQGYLFARPIAEFGTIAPEWAQTLGGAPAAPRRGHAAKPHPGRRRPRPSATIARPSLPKTVGGAVTTRPGRPAQVGV